MLDTFGTFRKSSVSQLALDYVLGSYIYICSKMAFKEFKESFWIGIENAARNVLDGVQHRTNTRAAADELKC